MRTNRNLILIFAGVLALALMSSCSKVKDIKITSVGLESLSPKASVLPMPCLPSG